MLRKALAECISEEDVMDLGRSLYLAARNGDWVAAKLLLSYVIGKPAPPADPDTLEAHEWGVFKALPVNNEDVTALLGGLQANRARTRGVRSRRDVWAGEGSGCRRACSGQLVGQQAQAVGRSCRTVHQ
jgi:hypothetical protein